MKKKLLFAILILACIDDCFSQQNYWQQRVDTRIQVTLDDTRHMLHGFEEITYTNNSPDTLHYIYMHLWPNAYKNDRTPFSEQQVLNRNTSFYYADENGRGYIDSLQFIIDEREAEHFSSQNVPDICRIDLARPVLPGATVKISTPFRVKIPEVTSRLGHSGQAYFISQWFPKPAVYDRKGWHPIAYLDQGEFYSEIGNYDVTITLPDNYIVMATGNCTNFEELAWLDSLGRLPLPSDTLYRKSWPRSNSRTKTLRYTEERIHDFAWFADKRWIVRTDTVSGDGNEGVTRLYTAFLPIHSKEWKHGTDYLKATINHYGKWVGKYPYKTMKAVEGDMNAGGGMEYPTVTVIDKGVVSDLKTVLIHEAGHNWFYGMLATNEREHPWMDEGMNTFYEQKTSGTIDSTNYSSLLERMVYYQSVAMNEDQPSALPATAYTFTNYGGDIYYKTAMLMHWLEQYMGKADFEAGMKEYFNTWKFKHPYPEDFRAIMQQKTPKSLDWFFDHALYTSRRIDFAVRSAKTRGDKLKVTVANRSDFAAPVAVTVYDKDSLVATAWTEPFSGRTSVEIQEPAHWTTIRTNAVIADLRAANNDYKKGGMFPTGGLKFRFLGGFSRQDKDVVYVSPALAYNNYDGFGLGILLNNLVWPQNRLQFALAPVYSFGSSAPNGAGGISYQWMPRRIFKDIRLQANIKTFSYQKTTEKISNELYARYLKIAPSLQFRFRENKATSTVTRTLTLKQYNIWEDNFRYTMNPDSSYRASLHNELNTYGLLRYEHRNDRTFHPFSYAFEAQMGENFAKLGLEGNIRIDYDIKGKSLYLRAYAGKFISIHAAPDNQRYYLNTTFSGVNDYLYDGTYFGRSETEDLLSRQVSVQEGGFKIPTNLYANPLGRSDDWLLALNIKTDLPLKKIPLRFFLDVGTFANAKTINPTENRVSYNGGAEIHLFGEVLSIYIPFLMSEDYSDYLESMYGNKRFEKSISFSLNFQHFNFLSMNEYIYKNSSR